MSQFFIDSNAVSGGSINTLSAEGGAATPPSGTNFNFTGSLSGGATANGAIIFSTPANGQMDGVVQVDNSTIFINASNQLQVSNSGFIWTVETANLTAVKGHGYFANSASPGPGALEVTIPAVSVVGDTFKVYAFNSNGFTIRQQAGQFCQLGTSTTTTGVGGSIVGLFVGTVVELVCSVANTQWEVTDYSGNLSAI